MATITMTSNDIQILTQLLENSIAELRGEIHETDNYEYKQMLKDRKEAMSKLYDALIQAHEEMPLAG